MLWKDVKMRFLALNVVKAVEKKSSPLGNANLTKTHR